MSNIVLLDSRLHRKLRLHALPSARHGDDQRFVSVVLNEFPLLALHYPILFSKDADTEQFYCGDAGVRCRREFVLEEQRALTAYRPLNLQRRPFFTSGSELAIDLEHSRVAPSGEQELFTESGEPSNYLRSIMDLMRPAARARAYAHFHANTVEPEAD